MTVLRYDTGSLGSVQRTQQGGIRVPASLTRAGLFRYQNPDGTFRVEYRPLDEVSRADSLATLADAPVTNLHHGLISPANWRKAAVGSLSGAARMDGDHVVADLVIQDAHVISLIESGERREVSLGYRMRLERTPGTFNGERYDAIQRDIKYNHVALVPRGRGGRDVALRLDAEDNQANPFGRQDDMKIEIINGTEYEVGTSAHRAASQAQGVAQAAAQVRLDALPTLEGANATLTAQVADLQTRLDAQPSVIAQAVQDRIALLAVGSRAGVDIREDMTDDEARRAVVSKLHPKIDLEGKEEAFVSAAFEIAISGLTGADIGTTREDALRARRRDGKGEEREDADTRAPDQIAREAMIKKTRDRANGRSRGTLDKS